MSRLLFLQDLEYEFLGPMYLSSAVKAHGHVCEMAIGNSIDDFSARIEAARPDLVGFSLMTGSCRWALEIAAEVKRRYGIRTIFGGAHPTCYPELLDHPAVDYMVRGEGEHVLLDVMNALDAGRDPAGIDGLSYKRADGAPVLAEVRRLEADIDRFPFADRDLYNSLDSSFDRSVASVITSRGCPYSCTFCLEPVIRDLYAGKGAYIRIRNIEKVLEECAMLKNQRGVRAIYFRDDVFGLDRKWLFEFLPRFKREIGLEFMCMIRANLVDDEYARALHDAGCRIVFWGIESGSERLRNILLKKRISDETIVAAASALHANGIRFMTFNIMGLPGETLDEAKATLEINQRIRTDFPWCSFFMPLPGTELARYAVEHSYLDARYNESSELSTFYTPSKLEMPQLNEISNLQRFFQTAVLWPWTTPVVMRLLSLPGNILFDLWFQLIYFLVHVRCEKRNLFTTLRFALRNKARLMGKGARRRNAEAAA